MEVGEYKIDEVGVVSSEVNETEFNLVLVVVESTESNILQIFPPIA